MTGNFPIDACSGWRVRSGQRLVEGTQRLTVHMTFMLDGLLRDELNYLVWQSSGMSAADYGRQDVSMNLWKAVADALNVGVTAEDIREELLSLETCSFPVPDFSAFEFVSLQSARLMDSPTYAFRETAKPQNIWVWDLDVGVQCSDTNSIDWLGDTDDDLDDDDQEILLDT